MNYEEYRMETIMFEENEENMFVVASTTDGDSDGSSPWSIKPDRSDS